MPQYQWSPPQHPDPPEDQPVGIDGVEWSDAVDHAPVWVDVEFSRTGPQRLPGFVDAAAPDRVYVQLVHMGNAHRLWLPRDRVSRRVLKPRRSDR
jgi:hypothetical protein